MYIHHNQQHYQFNLHPHMNLLIWLLILPTLVVNVFATSQADGNDYEDLDYLNHDFRIEKWQGTDNNTKTPEASVETPPPPPPPSLNVPSLPAVGIDKDGLPSNDSKIEPSSPPFQIRGNSTIITNSTGSIPGEGQKFIVQGQFESKKAKGKDKSLKKWHLGAGFYFNKELDIGPGRFKKNEAKLGCDDSDCSDWDGNQSDGGESGSGSESCSGGSDDEGGRGKFKWFKVDSVDGDEDVLVEDHDSKLYKANVEDDQNSRIFIPTWKMVTRSSIGNPNLYVEVPKEPKSLPKITSVRLPVYHRLPADHHSSPSPTATKSEPQTTSIVAVTTPALVNTTVQEAADQTVDRQFHQNTNVVESVSHANSIYLFYKFWAGLDIVLIYILFS